MDMKNLIRSKNIHCPIETMDALCKSYVDGGLNNPSIIRNNEQVDFGDINQKIVRFVKVNYMPAIEEHLTAKYYVDQAISNSVSETKFVRRSQDKDFSDFSWNNINSNTLSTQAIHNNQVITKSYVDQFHQENERSRKDSGEDFYNESNELVKNNQNNVFKDNTRTNLNIITVNRNPNSDNETANKKMTTN